ncbi:taste receptor type 2 member 39-like [Latimeria chalumnae]|uniref:taste receptor type 2 member 39-like n=1 Tax=Latimeria chalumnae TaxID=7897 RepID=UPI00313D878C
MATVHAILQLAAILFVIVLGIIGNLFITIVNFQELWRTGTLQPSELIVICIALSNILVVMVLAVWFTIFLLDLCIYMGTHVYQVTDFFIVFISKAGYWFTAWLCFFYCVKIVKVNWRIFLKLKQCISSLVSFLLMATIVGSFGLAYPCAYIIRDLNTTGTTEQCKYYHVSGQEEFMMGYVVTLSVAGSLLPLALMLLSSFGIVVFLIKHSKNMTKTSNASSSSRSEGPATVAKMLISLIILYMVSVVSVLVINHISTIIDSSMVVIIASSSCVFSAGSSVILIVGTVKLRQAFLKIFCSAGQCYNKCTGK